MKKKTYDNKVLKIIKDATGISTMASNRAIKRSTADTKIIKRARAYDNAPQLNTDGSVTDAFKARSAAESAKARVKKYKIQK